MEMPDERTRYEEGGLSRDLPPELVEFITSLAVESSIGDVLIPRNIA